MSIAVLEFTTRRLVARTTRRKNGCANAEDCLAVSLYGAAAEIADRCPECGSRETHVMPFLEPRGFTVDAARPHGGREPYRSGGRERAGYAPPAQLLVGASAVTRGENHPAFASRLYSTVHVGELFMRNMGPDRADPGFVLCHVCGRHLDEESSGSHTYPADVPPHWGQRPGPRAGDLCPNRDNRQNRVVLGHRFSSEVILLAVDLSESLDAPIMEPSGRAVWYSFGTLVAEAAARYLQVDPDEVQVGVRPTRDALGRVQGEVFIYDNVPAGAGYARTVRDNLREIVELAREMGRRCHNSECGGACYRCLLGYRNQQLHNLLDRRLAMSVIEFVLSGGEPEISRPEAISLSSSIETYLPQDWQRADSEDTSRPFGAVFDRAGGTPLGIWPIHPLTARPTRSQLAEVSTKTGVLARPHTSFDLLRRPFWVANDLMQVGSQL